MMNYTEWPHRRLDVWKRSMGQAKRMYKQTREFPSFEQFGLAGQLQRAAVSVPSNIAEGLARSTPRDKVRFLYNAQGSLSELDTQIELAEMVGYLNEETKAELLAEVHRVQMLLSGLIRSVLLIDVMSMPGIANTFPFSLFAFRVPRLSKDIL